MKKGIRSVGLDVHAETISAAVVELDGRVRSLGKVPNRPESIRKLMRRLEEAGPVRVCYEAGPTGFTLYWQLTGMGTHCDVVAPTLIPSKPGERVKTDRLDAEKLARSYSHGDLTPVWVPDAEQEALRDLVRAREAAKADQLRARHRLSKFLLRQGRRAPAGVRPWSLKYDAWLRREVKFDLFAHQATLEDLLTEVEHARDRIQRLEQRLDDAIEEAPSEMRDVIAGLQALRGIAKISAVSLVSEIGRFSRFTRARQLMAYSGVVSREHSSGERIRRGAITKTGNAHLRRVVGEAAWAYRHRPYTGPTLRKRQEGLPGEIIEIASKAQLRLHRRYHKLLGRGKNKQQTVTAVSRELIGFIWAIAVAIEQRGSQQPVAH